VKVQSDTVKPVGYGELVWRYKLRAVPHWVDSFIVSRGRSKATA